MNILKAEFTESGFTHKQIKRTDTAAIYERHKPRIGLPHFEVIKINVNQFRKIDEKRSIQAGESYPSANAWGSRGFTFTTIEGAEAKFEELTKEHQKL